MNFGDFWLQSNSNGKGKKFSLKDLHNIKPEDIAKNPKLQKLITLFDSDSSGNLETNELESIFADLKTAAKDDILSDNELGLYLSNKFKDQDIKVEDVKELLNAASDKQIQELNYTDLDGNSISDKFENGEIVERTITSQDENGNKVEVNVFYENKRPVKQLQIINNEIAATISYDYSKDSQNPTTTTIFKNKDGVVEEVNTPQKRTLTLYKTNSIDDFDKTKNHRLQQVVVTDKAQYVAEYDGKGNTLIIVQNSETPELIAQKFGIKLSDLIKVNKGLTRNTTLQAGQKLIVPSEINADSKVMKPRKSEGEVKQKAAQHAFGKVYDKIFASAIDEYEIKPENAGKDVYEYATKYLIRKGAKKTDPNFKARVNDLANELIALNGRDAKYTAGSKIKYIKKTLNQNTINQLKEAGMIPSQDNQLFFARFNYLTPQQQTNVIEVLKQCKAKGITDPQKINAEILRYYPEIQMFETDKKVLQKPTKAMARSYMAHYLLEQIDAIIAMYNQTATADQSLMTLGTGLIVELQDLLHISTKFINDNLGTCIAEGDSRVNLAPMLNKIRQECLNLCVLADMEEKNKDESFDKKKNIPGWEGSQFDKKFNELFYGQKSMNYDAVTTYLQAVQEFQKAPEKDRNNKNSLSYKKIEAATNKLNSQLPAFQDIAKRIEGWAGGTQIVGGLTDLGVQVAMLYLSGGGTAIARSSMYVGNATRFSVGTGMSRMAASRFGSTAVGRLLVKDGTQFITREGSAILASMVTSSAETAAFFQGTKVLGALEDGKVTGEEVAVINEGFEGLFKFGMVGSAIAGPLGAKASELTSKLLNSEKAIASTMKLAIEGKGTTLDKVLKALCENSNALSKITEFGTSFSINAGYMAVADNTGYGEAMGNLAQMDAVSKLVVAMLGGKNTAFLTPQKVQQIKTSLAGYEVKLSVYKGQKIYEVTDKAGAKTRLANEQELFMFIVDREVAELTKPETNIPEISTENSELRDKARTENPAVVAEAKVKEEWQQHDLDTKAAEEEVDLFNLDTDAGLKEPVSENYNEVTDLILKGKLGETLTRKYEHANEVFKEILDKHRDDIEELANKYRFNNREYAQGIINILLKEFGMEEVELKARLVARTGGGCNWHDGTIDISDMIDDKNELAEMISHEFVHLLQFREVLAERGIKGLQQLINDNKSMDTIEKRILVQKINSNPKFFVQMLVNVNGQQSDVGSMNYYLRKIYQKETANPKGSSDGEAYFDQLIEREAYRLGSNGHNLDIKLKDLSPEEAAKLKEENDALDKKNSIVQFYNPETGNFEFPHYEPAETENAEKQTHIKLSSVDDLKTAIRTTILKNHSKANDYFIDKILETCGEDSHKLNNMLKIVEAGYPDEVCKDMAKYMDIPEDILDGLLSKTRIDDDKFGYGLYSLVQQLYDGNGLKENYSEIFKTINHLLNQKDNGVSNLSARNIATIVKLSDANIDKANVFLKYMNIEELGNKQLEPEAIGQIIDFLYPQQNPEVENKLLHLLKLTPEQMQASDGIVLDGYFIKTILKDNFTNEQIDIVKNVLYDKDLAGLKPSEAMSVARDLNFDDNLINMFKELYSIDLHPKNKFERSKVEPNIARMIVRNYQDANIIRTIKYLLENNATKTENSSKLKEQSFVDGTLSKDDLTRMSEYLELIKDNQDLKSNLNFDFVRKVDRFEIVKAIISENKDITYQELKARIKQKELEIEKDKYRQETRLIADEELKTLAVEMQALSRYHKSLIPEMEDISFKLDGVEDDFVMAEIRKLLDECAENVRQANSSFEYINNVEKINMYLDIYHTLKSDYEYIGTRSELTPKREYYNYVTKHFGDKDVDGKFVQSAENRFKSAIDDRIAEDFEVEGRIERLKHYSFMFPKDEVINHFYKEYYLKEVPEEVRQICVNISDKYNTKLFLSSEGRENAPIILNFVENEFAEWYQKSNGKAIFPDVIDLTLIDRMYVDDKTAYGQSVAAGSSQLRKITLAGYSNVVYALRHELTHYNESLTNNINKYNIDEIMPHKIVDGVEVPDFENCKFKEEFLRAGIDPSHIDYAYNNTNEFIAVASEGDMSKYSPEFKQMLIDFGMPEWEFDLNITNPRIKQRSEYVDYLLEYGKNKLSIADENGNPIDISKNFTALETLMDIYEDCAETANNVAMEMRRHNVPNDPKKLFEYVAPREDREYILHDWSLVSRILTGEIENDNATLKEFLIKDLGIAEDKVGSATDNVYIKNTQLLQGLKERGYDINFINSAIDLGVLKTEVGGKMLEKLTKEDPIYQDQLLMFLTEDRIKIIKDRQILNNDNLSFKDIKQLSDLSEEEYETYKANDYSDVDILIDKFPANIKRNAVNRKLNRYKYLTISEIRDLARLSDDEFARLEATHKVGTGLLYTSKIPAIDDIFIRYKRICPSRSSIVYLKQIEKEIINDIKTNSLDATSHVEKVLEVLSNIPHTKNFDRVAHNIVVISSHLVAKGFDTNAVRKFVQLGIDEFKNDVNQEQFPQVVNEIKNHAEYLPLLKTILQEQELCIQDIGIVFTSINNSGNRKQSIELFKQLFIQNPKLDKSCFLFSDDQYKLLDHDLETNLNSPEALALINLLLRNDTYTNKQKGLILGLSTDFNADINKVIERVKNNYDANSLISYLTLDIPKFADALFDKISGMKTKEGHSVYSNIALSEIFKRITSENDVARLEKALSENQLTTKEIITFLEKGVLPAKTNARPFESFVDKVKATQVYKDYPDDSVNYTVMDSMREIYNKDPKNFDLFLEVFDFYAKTQAHISKPIGILWMFTKNSTTLSESLLKDLKKQKDGVPLINKYNSSIVLDEIVAKSQNGDIISRGNELYLVNDGKTSRINLKAETFETLFPLGLRFDSHQGHIGDCWLVKSIDTMMNNIEGQKHIYNLFRQEGNDIIVTIPNRDGQTSFSVRFKDGFVFNGGVNACNGVKLLETAFALSDRGRKSSNGTVNYNDVIKSEAEQHEMLEKNITSGNQSEFIHTICGVENYSEPIPMGIVLDNKDIRQNIEVDGRIKAKRTNNSDEMVGWIEQYANEKDILLHMATEPGKDDYESTISKEYDLYHRHAYEITGYDADRGLVYYKNPWHCNMTTSMDVYNFIEHLHYIEYFDMK